MAILIHTFTQYNKWETSDFEQFGNEIFIQFPFKRIFFDDFWYLIRLNDLW